MTDGDNVVPLRPRSLDLTNAEIAAINTGHCPDCNHRGFVLGPWGGNSQNVECGGCASRFNVGRVSFSHHVVMGQRIPRRDQGGSDWSA